MRLVRLENFKLRVEDELFLLTPFKKLYKSDRNRNKENFFNFLTVLYFVYDPRSDYSYIIDDKKRLEEVCAQNGFTVREFTPLETECIEIYKKLTTTTSLELLKSAKTAVDKIRNFLESVDLTALDDKKKPIYTVNSITTAVKQIPQLAKDLSEAEKTIAKEIQEQGRVRGGNERKSLMDDGLLF